MSLSIKPIAELNIGDLWIFYENRYRCIVGALFPQSARAEECGRLKDKPSLLRGLQMDAPLIMRPA